MLYNSSGINNLPADQGTLSTLFSYITGAWQDVIETLWQIATQNQRNAPSWYEYLLYIFMNYGTQNALSLETVSLLYQADNPPTQSDINTMSAALSNWYNAGDDILLVAHSQGNLFAESVYNAFTSTYGASHIVAYDIAPPTSLIPGQYTLNSLDLVIALAGAAESTMGLQASPPPPNVTQFCSDDWSGHTLGCYLENPVGAGITSTLAASYATLRFGGYPPLPPAYVTLPFSSATYNTTGYYPGVPTQYSSLSAAEAAETYIDSMLPPVQATDSGPWTLIQTGINNTTAVQAFFVYQSPSSSSIIPWLTASNNVEAIYSCSQTQTVAGVTSFYSPKYGPGTGVNTVDILGSTGPSAGVPAGPPAQCVYSCPILYNDGSQ